ncbi:MAG: hypothetical protein QXP01_07785, partial [Candidatus Hadarchaeum sp.]
MRWRDLVTITPRYTRSINVERDAHSEVALEGYIITPTAHATLIRITNGLSKDSGQRAWTVTGPYGSGKSAFALFLSNLLGFWGLPSVRKARTLLRNQFPDTYKAIFQGRNSQRIERIGFCSVLIGGTSAPLLPVLVDSL